MDEDLLKKWRRLALEKETTLSQWVTDEVTRTLSKEERYEAARKNALKWLKKGFHLGGKPLTREECHER
jgi:hypothetical protein